MAKAPASVLWALALALALGVGLAGAMPDAGKWTLKFNATQV